MPGMRQRSSRSAQTRPDPGQADYTTLNGGTTPDQTTGLIQQVEQEIATAHGLGPDAMVPGFVVAGGGIGTLLGAHVIIRSGGIAAGNYAGIRVESGNPSSVGVGGGSRRF
jgi:hypothetical protein